MQKIINNLTANLQKFCQQAQKKKVVVGVSGGVDSACVLALAVRILGKENVFALLMPHQDFSSTENLDDARELARRLEVDYQEIEISNLCQSYFDLFQTETTRANIMPRVRMTLLYALANELNALVLGTCNKTEILTGFFTKFGDGGADVEVIGDLWKTEVWELARNLELSEKFINKTPSAELFVGHSDEEEMGVKYSEIDCVLQKIEQDKNFVPQTEAEKKVWDLYQKSAHKRKMPPIIKAY